jgi:hypothetical protein
MPDLHNRQTRVSRDEEEYRMCRIFGELKTVQFLPRGDPTRGAVGTLALLASKSLSSHFLGLSFQAHMI